MKLVFLGPPGAGKGTQAGAVAKAYGIAHISTGDMFRAAIANQTPTGMRAKAFIDAGQLVPDQLTIDMVDERLREPDCHDGYLLDGFPRTVDQAEALDRIAAPDAVVEIAAPDEKLIVRLSGRRICGACKGTSHVELLENPGVCPTCGGELIQRSDDTEEAIRVRLAAYHAKTSPLIEYYLAKGILKTVDGARPMADVKASIFDALGFQA